MRCHKGSINIHRQRERNECQCGYYYRRWWCLQSSSFWTYESCQVYLLHYMNNLEWTSRRIISIVCGANWKFPLRTLRRNGKVLKWFQNDSISGQEETLCWLLSRITLVSLNNLTNCRINRLRVPCLCRNQWYHRWKLQRISSLSFNANSRIQYP